MNGFMGRGGRVVAAAAVGVFALFAPGASPGAAQQVERERQEVLLPTVGVVEITPELRGRLGLFPEVQGFRVARLFLRADGVTLLEIEFVQGGVLQRERRTLSPAELDALRRDLSQRLDDPTTRIVATREGRGGLVLSQTLMGLGFYGWAVPMALDLSSGQAIVGTYLVTAGAAFYLPYRLTENRTVTDVHRSVSTYGGSRGIISGHFIGDLMRADNARDPMRVRSAAAVVTGVMGAASGFAAVDRSLQSMGDAQLWQAAGDAGILSGAALAYLSGPYKTEWVEFEAEWGSWREERYRNRRAGHAITLAGQGVGLAAGMWLAGRREYSAGDVSVLRSTTVLGAQTGGALARVAGGDRREPLVAGALAGGLLGIVAGDRWLPEAGLGTGEGLLVNAGHIAGSAAALGLTYLLTSEIEDQGALYLTTAALGGWLGAGVVYRAVSKDTPLRTGWAPLGGSGLRGAGVTLDPAALILSSLGALERPGTERPGTEMRGTEMRGIAPGGEEGMRTSPPPAWLTIRF
jgi:hypothetical protein